MTTPRRKVGAEFLAKARYKNTLQPLPFGPKSLLYPLPSDHLYSFTLSSLEKYATYAMVMPELPIDLIQLGVFDEEELEGKHNAPKDANLQLMPVDKRDEPLLVQPHTPGSIKTLSLAKNRPLVPWLRKTEYIDSEVSKYGGQKSTVSKFDKAPEPQILSKQTRSRDGQIRVVESSFTKAQATVGTTLGATALRHPNKPHLTVAETLPLLPDLSLWPNIYMHVTFDDDPTVKGGRGAQSDSTAHNDNPTTQRFGLFRPRISEQIGATVFGYYAPTVPSVTNPQNLSNNPNQDSSDSVQYDYRRDYIFQSKPESQLRKLVVRLQDGQQQNLPPRVTYCSVHSRLRVSKRRGKHTEHAPDVLSVKRRKLRPDEIVQRQDTITDLGVPEDEALQYVCTTGGNHPTLLDNIDDDDQLEEMVV